MLPTEISPTLKELREKKSPEKTIKQVPFYSFICYFERERKDSSQCHFSIKVFSKFFFPVTLQVLAIINKKIPIIFLF